MQFKKALIAGITGTSLMTLFSYLLSYKKGKNFKEPETLSILLKRLAPDVKKKYTDIACWNVHYAVGVFFATIYTELWDAGKLTPNVKNSLLLGGISGLFAILVWKSVFKLHPNPPQKHFSNYYGQLFTAHVIFGVGAYAGYKVAIASSSSC